MMAKGSRTYVAIFITIYLDYSAVRASQEVSLLGESRCVSFIWVYSHDYDISIYRRKNKFNYQTTIHIRKHV
eukprot:jgi/Botrbrau1/6023/Bobra.0042s0009.1